MHVCHILRQAIRVCVLTLFIYVFHFASAYQGVSTRCLCVCFIVRQHICFQPALHICLSQADMQQVGRRYAGRYAGRYMQHAGRRYLLLCRYLLNCSRPEAYAAGWTQISASKPRGRYAASRRAYLPRYAAGIRAARGYNTSCISANMLLCCAEREAI